jgi:hypothetical protein
MNNVVLGVICVMEEELATPLISAEMLVIVGCQELIVVLDVLVDLDLFVVLN